MSENTIIKSRIIRINYLNPTIRNYGERKSKLLNPDSELFHHIKNIKNALNTAGFIHSDRMELHSEVLNNDNENLQTFLNRVQSLEGREIDIYNPDNYAIVGRAVVLLLGVLDGYNNPAKITIAFFDNFKMRTDALEFVRNYIK